MKIPLVISLLSASLAVAAYAANVDKTTQTSESFIAGGKAIKLDHASAERVKTFRKTGAFFYYPTFVPARYSLSSIKFDSQGDVQHPDYQMEFCDKNHHFCFSIESAYSGIGDDGDGDRHLKGRSKYFGSFTIDVYKPGSEGNGGKNIYYLSSWLKDKKMTVAEKKSTLPTSSARFYHFLGEGINDKEALAIVESLVPVESSDSQAVSSSKVQK
jgi:hypothetical protein